jgi:hypothetical protein
MSFENARSTSPLPTTLEDAIAEILNLRRILAQEREQLAKQWERRMLDSKAAAGNIKALREENARLRTYRKVLHRNLKAAVDYTNAHLDSPDWLPEAAVTLEDTDE